MKIVYFSDQRMMDNQLKTLNFNKCQQNFTTKLTSENLLNKYSIAYIISIF